MILQRRQLLFLFNGETTMDQKNGKNNNHSVNRVIHSDDWEYTEEVFLAAPYQAELEGKPFSNASGTTTNFTEQHEKRFLESVREEVNRMHTMPHPKGKASWDYSEVGEWFRDSTEILHEGFLNGEPNMMFLYARYIEG